MDEVTILVIDDEQSYLDLITLTLEKRNYNVLQAINGKMGCEVAERFLPDIIIVDWEMPVMNGIEAIKVLKSKESTRLIPIIMATGIMTSSEHLETALTAGAVDYIRKPIDSIELLARLNSSLKLALSYKQLSQQFDKVQALNSTKDKFFSIISHDLRGPVSSFKTFIDLMLGSNFDLTKTEDLKDMLKIMQKSASNTYDLLENLLLWSKSEKNELVIQPTKVNIKKLAEECIENLIIISAKKEILVEVEMDGTFFAFCEENMVRTVVRNLLSNAVKFTNRGGLIKVKAQIEKNMVIVSIADNGVGISPYNLDKIFNKLHHFSTYGTDNEKGAGMGLTLCKEFVERHNGKIWMESTLGEGSTFSFSLPSAV
jgi:two-component system, sensor histidine kinase and response regulator